MSDHTKTFLRNNSAVLFFVISFTPIILLAAFLSGHASIAYGIIVWLCGWGVVIYNSWCDYVHALLKILAQPPHKAYTIKYT